MTKVINNLEMFDYLHNRDQVIENICEGEYNAK